jgi:hypothetical protein
MLDTQRSVIANAARENLRLLPFRHGGTEGSAVSRGEKKSSVDPVAAGHVQNTMMFELAGRKARRVHGE